MNFWRCVSVFMLLAMPSVTTWAQCSPIVVDLGKDGIQMGPAGVGVHFDVNADGGIDHVQWVRSHGDEAFLAVDRNGNGLVDDGSELFGVGTPLYFDGGSAPNGFVGLAQYDLPALGGNDDGLITNADQIWPELYLWRDDNADGVASAPEMLRPGTEGVTSFQTIPKFDKQFDEAGNIIPYWGWATSTTPPQNVLMVDIYFLVLPEQSVVCRKPSPTFEDSSESQEA